MMQTFKILKGYDKVDPGIWFNYFETTRPTRLSSHPLNIRRVEISNTDIRNKFYSQRVINMWNNLPDYVKESKTISSFKTNYSSYASTMVT